MPQPVVHGDKPGAQAYVTISPAVGKASQQPELKHLRGIPDANPTPSAYQPTSLPTADDAEKHWLAVNNKQQYLDCATEVVDKFFDEKMPAPAASVTALVAGVLKVYRVVMDDMEGADTVEGSFHELWATLTAVLEAERKNTWAMKTIQELHVALATALRPLTPPILEALENLHHQTTRPTPDAKNRVRKAVAKRLALLASRIEQSPAELPEVGRVITERTIITALAQPTNNFTLGPRVTTDSLVWYAFFTELPEQCSWKVFKQRFVEWPHWPQGVVSLIDTLTLKDPNAAAWKIFCANMQTVLFLLWGGVVVMLHTTTPHNTGWCRHHGCMCPRNQRAFPPRPAWLAACGCPEALLCHPWLQAHGCRSTPGPCSHPRTTPQRPGPHPS